MARELREAIEDYAKKQEVAPSAVARFFLTKDMRFLGYPLEGDD
jgi:hypothetical protein